MWNLAVGASAALMSAVGLVQCTTDPQYAERCHLEGGYVRAVPGTGGISNVPLRGWCDHPEPDNRGTQWEIDVCIWVMTERGSPGPAVCEFVANEANSWRG